MKKTKEKKPPKTKKETKLPDCLTSDETKAYLNNRIWEKFGKWITGQTCPVMEDGKLGYYSWDVERFADMILERKPTYWD